MSDISSTSAGNRPLVSSLRLTQILPVSRETISPAVRGTFMRRTMLIVDDDALVRRAMLREFRSQGFDVDVAVDYSDALDGVRRYPPDVALVDVFLAERASTGITLIEEARRIAPCTAFVAISGHATVDLTTAAMRAGAVDVLEKPIDVAKVQRSLDIWKSSLSSLDVIRWTHIHAVLGANRGNKSRTARHLGCSRPGLDKMLQRSPPRVR
jgi:two-component system, response regulator RegA